MLMNFLGNQNHKIATQNCFLTKANLQESIHKNTQMISKDGIYDFFITELGNWHWEQNLQEFLKERPLASLEITTCNLHYLFFRKNVAGNIRK